VLAGAKTKKIIIATPAFDFNFIELLTLGIFTTEGLKIIIIIMQYFI